MFEKEMGKKETTHKIKKDPWLFSLSAPYLFRCCAALLAEQRAPSGEFSSIFVLFLLDVSVGWLCTLVKKTVVVDLIQLIY